MDAVQPGTRCECHERMPYGTCSAPHYKHPCPNSAVRLVPVPDVKLRNGIRRESMLGPKKVPMCKPCAAHHDEKAVLR